MCHSRHYGSCLGCHHGLTRRSFVKGCGLALATGGWAVSGISLADESKKKPVRIGLVFLSKPGSSWPHPKFDVEAREKEIQKLLRVGCPGIEFVPVAVGSPPASRYNARNGYLASSLLGACFSIQWSIAHQNPSLRMPSLGATCHTLVDRQAWHCRTTRHFQTTAGRHSTPNDQKT